MIRHMWSPFRIILFNPYKHAPTSRLFKRAGRLILVTKVLRYHIRWTWSEQNIQTTVRVGSSLSRNSNKNQRTWKTIHERLGPFYISIIMRIFSHCMSWFGLSKPSRTEEVHIAFSHMIMRKECSVLIPA